jgi:hypothetical protein
MAHPTLGRIVHYVAPGSADGTYPPAHRAAVVTEPLPSDAVAGVTGLLVFNPTGIHFVHVYEDQETKSHFTWHWPERDA